MELRHRRILIVEDEPMIALLLQDELRHLGADVVGPAATVSEAMRLIDAAAANEGIDAAILDFRLANEPVLPVADRLSSMRVPFAFCTASPDVVTSYRAAPVIAKPCDPERLIAALSQLLPLPPPEVETA
jgi:DNA-binding response OmpR family regulator